jgi:uncharacterized protein YbjT (DUF2867 family)
MTTILVAGATGRTGRLVVGKLQADGHRVRILARDEATARTILGRDVEIRAADVRDASSLRGSGRGVDGAICTLGTRSYFGSNGGAAVDAIGTRNLVEVLAAEGVPHIVHMSAFGLDRRSIALRIFSSVLAGYFRHKAAAEHAVRSSGIAWTIVRPVELRDRPPRSPPLLNQQDALSLLRTISRDLVADVLVECVGHPSAVHRTFELCEGGTDDLGLQLSRMLPESVRRHPLQLERQSLP